MSSERSVQAIRRVLHIIDTGGPGGAETVLDSIVAHLTPELWSSRVLVPYEDWLSDRLRSRGADVDVVPSRRGVDPGLVWRLMREIRAFGPAIIHAHLLGSGVYGTIAAELSGGTPLICTFHGRPDVDANDRLLSLKARILSRPQNRIVYVSYDLREHLEPLLGVPPGAGVVIHNGVAFCAPTISGNERWECGAGPGDVLIGVVGNIRPAKDYECLLRAAAIVCRTHPDAKFALVGDDRTPLADSLREMTDNLGLADRVRFLGFRKDAAALMSSFDIFVSSSSTEGLPLGTVEAVALGTPVVLTRVGGVPEVVESGRTGLLVPPGDPVALANGILETLAAPELAVEMAAAGAADVRLRFSARRMCDDYEGLYEQLVSAL